MAIMAIFCLLTFVLASGYRILDNFLGITFENSKVNVVDYGGEKGLGLILKENAKHGDVLLSIPLNYTFTSMSDFALYKYISDLEHHTIIAARFIYEKYKNPDSFFGKFVSTFLPDCNLMLFWDEQLKSFFNEHAIRVFELENFVKHWEADYEILKKRLENVEETPQEMFNLTIWKWGYSNAVAKTFDIWADRWKAVTGKKVEKTDHFQLLPFSIPVLDSIKHGNVPRKFRFNMSYLEEFDGKAHFLAQRNYKKGEEAMLEYENSNYHLLLNWGFATERNYLEEFILNLHGRACTETKTEDTCRWTLKMHQFNERLYDYFANEEGDHWKTIRRYRKTMEDIMKSDKHSLRELRRMKENYDWRYGMALNYGICQRILLLEQKRFAEQKALIYYLSLTKLDLI